MHALPHPFIATPIAWFDIDAAPVATTGSQRCFHIASGALRVGARTDQMQVLLGSCVGIALLWKKRGRCGLAHCLLPGSSAPPANLGARYVSQAVPSLLRLMGACAADYADIEVVVAGGANMLEGCSSRLRIGQQNIDAARRQLDLHGLRLRFADVGGNCGRTLTVDCATQEVKVCAIAPTAPARARSRVALHA
ncbi:hypothetical protein ASF61_20850 [Duganella sp. Leaf126]|uniref:chemotaxis protein CheD n=1 Tax=Duganella sp. Leaf126 TaxID=1736266 RepID=UPI0006F6E963|nr:chemotaxis protein CheD [Duganella sp. Leaf126]KQQ45086.1 hypothetical protein ASF61_20850 [Duganella sp. Leaf126]